MYKIKLYPKHQISYIYFLFASTWIVLTNILFEKTGINHTLSPSIKGLFFTTVTAYLLDLLIEKHYGAKLKIQRERDEAIGTYTELFEQHGLPHLLIDPSNGEIVQANEAAAAYYGWDRETICSMNIDEINTLTEEDIFFEMAAARAQFRNHFKFRHRRKHGDIRDVEVYSHPVKLNGRRFLYSIIIDVTEKKEAQQALQGSNRLLKSLVSSIRSMLQYHDKQGIADAVTRALVEEGGYRMVWIGQVSDNPSIPITVLSKWGDTQGYLENVIITWDSTEAGQGPTGRAIKFGKPQRVDDINIDPNYKLWRRAAQKKGFRSSVALPLFQRGRVFAVLILYSGEPNAFDDEEIGYLEALAADLSRTLITINTLHKFDKVDDEKIAAISHSKEALLEVVSALSSTVEVRDPYTAGHQRRVTWLAVQIGKQLGLTDARLEALNIASLLHDIGKISIPSEILSKPGRLSTVEFELIKQHPKVGEEILSKVSFDWPIATIVGQHHERLDGTGYPRGLTEQHILLEARILAIADVMEAMISHRPYRPGLSLEQACLELEQGLGIKYDGDAVKACIKIMREGGYHFLGVAGEPIR